MTANDYVAQNTDHSVFRVSNLQLISLFILHFLKYLQSKNNSASSTLINSYFHHTVFTGTYHLTAFHTHFKNDTNWTNLAIFTLTCTVHPSMKPTNQIGNVNSWNETISAPSVSPVACSYYQGLPSLSFHQLPQPVVIWCLVQAWYKFFHFIES